MQRGSDQRLEERLTAAGKYLLKPPTSRDELMKLLNQIEKLLARVEQSPATPMQAALAPLMNALVADELLKHRDVDVKIGLASCFSEITRITAPDAPYDDDKMKVIFQLTVSSFENFSEKSRSYQKRVSMLETVAKVRSCVIMLDLECDDLILEMYKNFFKAIRPSHEEIIFESMETIMTLVIEESEEISSDMINLILSNSRRDNEVNPMAKKLAERVIQNTSARLRPYLVEAVKSLNSSPDDYCEAVALICRENPSVVEHSNESVLKDQTEDGSAESNRQHKHSATDRAPKSVSNGSNEVRGELTTQVTLSSKAISNHLPDAKSSHKSEDSSDPEGPVKPDAHVECTEAEKTPDNQERPAVSVRICSSGVKCEEGKAKASVKDGITSSPSQASANDAADIASRNRGSIADESHSDQESPEEKKNSAKKQISDDTGFQKVSEGYNLSEVKQQQSSQRKQVDEVSNICGGDGGSARNSEAISADQKIGTDSDKVDGGSLSMKDVRENGGGTTSGAGSEPVKRKRGRPRLERPKTTVEDNGKEKSSSPSLSNMKKDEVVHERTPRMSSKGKQAVETEKEPDAAELGENLIGLKIKVWWPTDRMFYEGVVASYDSAKKKHKVLYTDGDMEILNLQKQRWEHVKDDVVSDEDKDAEHSNHTAPTDARRKRKRNSISDPSNKRPKSEDSLKIEDKDSQMPEVKATPDAKPTKSKPGKKSSQDATKSEDGSQKQGGKLEGGSANASSRPDVDSPRISSQEKQDKEGSIKSEVIVRKRGRPPGSGKKANSSSTQVKGTDKIKGEADAEKSSENVKVKNPDTSTPETQSVKKRKR